MRPSITIVIPAWNEKDRIRDTLLSLGKAPWKRYSKEVVVVDDGSKDGTSEVVGGLADRVIRHPSNLGKGKAMETGWRATSGEVILFLDADLGSTAGHAWKLLDPILRDQADMTIAILPPAMRKGGFGFVKGLASLGIHRLCGFRAAAPLSGQRAIRREVLERIGGLAGDFGIEVGLTIDTARSGYRIREVEVPLRHRETGRDLSGFVHRGKQLVQVGKTLLHKWREPV